MKLRLRNLQQLFRGAVMGRENNTATKATVKADRKFFYISLMVVLNIGFLIGVYTFLISPLARDVSQGRGAVQRQENNILARGRLELFYQDNLRELEILNENRRLLNQYEFGLELDRISNLAHVYGLDSLVFTVSDPVTIDTFEFSRLVQQRVFVEKEGDVSDILELLHGLKNIPANLVNANMVWHDDSRARINIELLLLWA